MERLRPTCISFGDWVLIAERESLCQKFVRLITCNAPLDFCNVPLGAYVGWEPMAWANLLECLEFISVLTSETSDLSSCSSFNSVFGENWAVWLLWSCLEKAACGEATVAGLWW